MKRVGVIGAGTMGQGIANAFASNGYDVTVCDIKLEWAQGGIDKISKKFDKLVAREKMSAETAEERFGRLRSCSGSCFGNHGNKERIVYHVG